MKNDTAFRMNVLSLLFLILSFVATGPVKWLAIAVLSCLTIATIVDWARALATVPEPEDWFRGVRRPGDR